MEAADNRNQEVEEERSPEGLEEVEKKFSHSKNLFRNRKKRQYTPVAKAGGHLASLW